MSDETSSAISLEADALRQQLLGSLKDEPLNLDTIIRVGETIYGNREHVHLYDMPPQVYYQKEMTIAGRTAIECIVDQDAIMLANDASQVIKSYPHPKTPIVIDLFTGSGNLLYHVTRSIGARYAIGFESSTAVYRLTQNNLWKLGFTAELIPSEFESSLHHNLVPENSLCLVIIDPPWSQGFSFEKGLDLRYTDPPVMQVLEHIRRLLPGQQILYIIKVYEILVEESVDDIVANSQVYTRRVSTSSPPGKNIGWIIGAL